MVRFRTTSAVCYNFIGDNMDNILKRRSYRKFSDEPIEDNLIIDIIRAGMQAPSSFDQRPWHFLVIRNLKLLNTLATITPYSM